jgi:hypothetical protein
MSDQVIRDRANGIPVNNSYESALWRNVWSQQSHIPNALLGEKGMKRRLDKTKGARTDDHIPFHMERLEYGKRLKMLSLNPSVYGNIYGVLGSS